MGLNRREVLGLAGGAAASIYGIDSIVEDLDDDILLNSDYNRMEVGNAVYLTTFSNVDVDSLSLEYQAPDSSEWMTAQTLEESRNEESGFSYGFHEEVNGPGEYVFRGAGYENGELKAISEKEIVKFVDEIESGL